MDINDNIRKQLAEVGFIAAGHGFLTQAETIFRGLQAARPDSEYPLIGLAFTAMNARQPEQAVKILKEQALKIAPDSAYVQSFLGLFLHLSGHQHESRQWLQQAAASEDQDAAAMAQALLDNS